VGADPVGQALRPRGFGEGVVAGAKHGHQHGGLADLACAGVVDRNRVAGIVDEELLAGPVLVTQDDVLPLEPGAVQAAVTAVAVAFRLLLAVLLPEQLQRQMLVRLQLAPHRGKVGIGGLPPRRGRTLQRQQRGHQPVLVPLGYIRPSQPGLVGQAQVVGNRGLTDLTAQRDLALAQPEVGQPQDSLDLVHGQPLLRQPESSTSSVESSRPPDCPAPTLAKKSAHRSAPAEC
jgi:hypothetical protein